MLKAKALFSRKKGSRPFKDYYTEWFNTLKNTLLPLLGRSISKSSPTLLSTNVDSLLHHFLSYYQALDLAASTDVSQLLYPDWRNSIEKPFLWLGDFHPYLFTNLLRSFLDDSDDGEDDGASGSVSDGKGNCTCDFDFDFDKPWQIAMAWKNPSGNLTSRIEQLECGLRLMVPALVARARTAQEGFIQQVSENWFRCQCRKEAGVNVAAVEEAVNVEMDEMVSVFMDANRLRRSVLSEIIGATSVYQAALFLEGLAQFIVGFKDPELVVAFERCKIPLSSQSWLQL